MLEHLTYDLRLPYFYDPTSFRVKIKQQLPYNLRVVQSDKDNWANSSIKFLDEGQALPYESLGAENDIHFYGQVVRLASDSPYDFMIEPQIFFPHTDNGVAYGGTLSQKDTPATAYGERYNDISKLPELYVVVCVEFESGPEGRKFVYSRVYLPEIKKINYGTACSVANEIEQRAASDCGRPSKQTFRGKTEP